MTAVQQLERQGLVTFKGGPMTLVGPALHPGDTAPHFSLTAGDMSTVTLNDAIGHGTRAALLIVVPSIDTSVCALETVRFNREVESIPSDKLGVYTVSVDLPFAQSRWSKAENVTSVQLLSDFKDHHFGPDWGVLIKELGLLARSVFLVDKGGIIRYVEIVPEIAQEPDYEKVLAHAKELIG